MDVFSNLMVAGECLLDIKRTQFFENAIAKTVKKILRNKIILIFGISFMLSNSILMVGIGNMMNHFSTSPFLPTFFDGQSGKIKSILLLSTEIS